jgi:C-terminal processing protease CtpA/Prc
LIEQPQDKNGIDPAKKVPKKKVTCKKYYTGIGIQTEIQNSVNERIWNVFKGYPADQNGLLAGDVILAKSEDDITGPEGTPITLTIMRYGNIFKVTLIRSKICY